MKRSCVQFRKIVQEQVQLDNSNRDNCCNFIIKRNYHLLDFKKLFIVVLLKWKWFLTLNCNICDGTFFETDKTNHRTGLDLTNICWHSCRNKHRIIKMTFEMCWQSCRSSRMWCDRLRINVRDFRLQFPLSRGLGKEKSLFEKITTLNVLILSKLGQNWTLLFYFFILYVPGTTEV